jgi:heme/copper-type cytochrome/quinol oxidase subunit 2
MDAFFVSVVIVVVEMASFVGVIDVRRVKTRRPGAPFWNHNDTTLIILNHNGTTLTNLEPQRHHAHEF